MNASFEVMNNNDLRRYIWCYLRKTPKISLPLNLGSVSIYKPNNDNMAPINRVIGISSFFINAPMNITNMLPPNNINAPIPVSIVRYE